MTDIDNGTGDQKPEPSNTSMRDALASTFEKMQSDEPVETAKPVIAATDAVPAQEPDTEQPSGAKRDPATGKFTKPADKQVTDKPLDAGAVPAAAPEAPNPDPAKTEGSKLPPTSWSVAAKTEWASLPPAIQDAVLKREEEVSKGFAQKAEEMKGHTQLEQIIGPRRQALSMTYGSVENALKSFFDMSDFATRDPEGFIKWYAPQRGVDLSRLVSAGQAAEPGQQTYASEQLPAEHPQIAALAKTVQQITGFLENQTASQQKQEEARISSDVEKFAADPKNLYFANVRDDMALLIKQGLAVDIQDAYDKAIWQNPEIRAGLREADRKAAEEARKAEVTKKATEATRVNATNLSSQGNSAGSTPTAKDPRELMSEVFDKMNAA